MTKFGLASILTPICGGIIGIHFILGGHEIVGSLMDFDENDVFDESVDPYDRSIDRDYDDGISVLPPDKFDDVYNDWDTVIDDKSPLPNSDLPDEETADYDEIDD